LRTGAPLVPVGIIGTRDIQPPGARAPRPFRPCEIRIGRPLDVARYRERVDDRLLLRQVTDELMYEIRELSGQHYVDEYATRKHDAMPSQPTALMPGTDGPTGRGERGERRGADGDPAGGDPGNDRRAGSTTGSLSGAPTS
jgi:1-acyl-sn-glycerol-3-phosphate acyltransferase